MKNDTKHNSKLILATVTLAFVASMAYVQSAEALANHATHTMNSQGGAYPEMWGIKATYSTDDTSISTGSIAVPTWVILDTGIYREVGWTDGASASMKKYWGVDGDIEWESTSISDNTSYNWEVSNVNEDYTWEGAGPSFSKSETNFSYGDEAVDIQTGIEYSHTSITLPTITFSSQQVYVDGGWENWDDFDNGRVGETDPSDAYVLECGNDYTSEHGEGSQPGSC